MRGVALCAGIGGLELGVSLAVPAYRTVCHVEREVFSAARLAALMEEGVVAPAPIWDDVASFDGAAWRGLVDCVTAGFPCQPWSAAGSGAGTADERWIWPDIRDRIREMGPRFVFLENVPPLVSRGGLALVLGDLADLGFDAEWLCLSAADVGASHRRERLFILAVAHPDLGRRDAIGQSEPAGIEGAHRRESDGCGGLRELDDGASAGRPAARAPLANADGRLAAGRRGEARGPSGTGPRDQPAGPSTKLGDADCAGLQGLGGDGLRSDEPGRNDPASRRPARAAGDAVADAGGSGLSGREQCGESGPAQRGFDTGPAVAEFRAALVEHATSAGGPGRAAHTGRQAVPRPEHASGASVGDAECAQWGPIRERQQLSGGWEQTADRPRHTDAPLADPGDGFLPLKERGPLGGGRLGSAGQVLGDAAHGGRRELRQSSECERLPARTDPDVADADCGTLRLESERDQRDRRRERATEREHLESGPALPLFPPAPTDRRGWQWLLEHWPELAPACVENTARLREHGPVREDSGRRRRVPQAGHADGGDVGWCQHFV